MGYAHPDPPKSTHDLSAGAENWAKWFFGLFTVMRMIWVSVA